MTRIVFHLTVALIAVCAVFSLASDVAMGQRWGSFKKDACVSTTHRQYSSQLLDIPWGKSWEDACAETGATVQGQSFRKPNRCVNNNGMWGEFDVPDQTCAQSCGKQEDGCWAWAPCCEGYSCHPFIQKCFHEPRRLEEPCVAGFGCGPGLSCQPGVHKCFHEPRQLEEPCVAGFECGPGLTCQPGVQKCFHEPRQVYEPCVAGFGCGEGLFCQAATHVCVPNPLDTTSIRSCKSVWVGDLAIAADNANATMSYGLGGSATAGVTGSIETGVVYGEDGQFGCYAAVCAGVKADVSIGTYANVGVWNSWDDVVGSSFVLSEGVSVPFLELGFTTSQVLNTAGGLIGSVNSLTFGVGLNPVEIGGMTCCTAVLEDSQPMNALNASIEMCQRQLEGIGGTSQPYIGNASYVLMKNAAISGHNTEHLNNRTVDQCMEACDQRGWCTSFDYYKNDQACDLSVMNAYMASLRTTYPGNPYDHYTKTTITYRRVTNAAISGHNRERVSNVTPSQCMATCNARSWCRSFDYYKNDNACDLSDQTSASVGGLTTNYPGNPYDHYQKN